MFGAGGEGRFGLAGAVASVGKGVDAHGRARHRLDPGAAALHVLHQIGVGILRHGGMVEAVGADLMLRRGLANLLPVHHRGGPETLPGEELGDERRSPSLRCSECGRQSDAAAARSPSPPEPLRRAQLSIAVLSWPRRIGLARWACMPAARQVSMSSA